MRKKERRGNPSIPGRKRKSGTREKGKGAGKLLYPFRDIAAR